MIAVLLYTLEQGPTEKKIIEQCVRQKLPLPARIANAPEVFVGLEMYYLAFLDLTSERTQGYAEGPIGWLSIAEYADRAELSDEQREDMFFYVTEMDVAYLKYRGDKIAASTSQVS